MYHPQTDSGEEGRAIQIVLADDEHNFELDEKALAQVLLRDDIKDLPVAVVSVAGAFRKGKSFMLDFFLRYLRASVRTHTNFRDCSLNLSKFDWRVTILVVFAVSGKCKLVGI
jgi:atlastin